MKHSDAWTVLFIIVHVVIVTKPTPVEVTSTVTRTKVGRTAILPCRPKLDQSVDWEYRKSQSEKEVFICLNGQVVTANFTARFSLNNYDLCIRDVQLSDSGAYTCIENSGMGDHHTVQLDIIDDVTMRINAAVGESVVLPCDMSFDAPADWVFTKSGQEATTDICVGGKVIDGYVDDYSLVTAGIRGQYNLRVHSVLPDETAGLYTCVEDAGVGIEHKFNVTIRDDWTYISPGKSVAVNIGSSVILRCHISSSFIRLAFTTPGSSSRVLVYNGAKFNAEFVGRCSAHFSRVTNENYFVFHNVARNDSGTYNCWVPGTQADQDVFNLRVFDNTDTPTLAEFHGEEASSLSTGLDGCTSPPQHTSQAPAISVGELVIIVIMVSALLVGISIKLIGFRRRSHKIPHHNQNRETTGGNVRELDSLLSTADAEGDTQDENCDSSKKSRPYFTLDQSTNRGEQVRGLCVQGDKLYVARDANSEVAVYNRHSMKLIDRLSLSNDIHPCSMAIDTTNDKCLYITYYINKTVCRITLDGGAKTHWKTSSEPDGIAVIANSGNVIVVLRTTSKLVEYTSSGAIVSTIALKEGSQPRYVSPFKNDQFLVCYGYGSGGIWVVDRQGNITPVSTETDHPLSIAVHDCSGFVLIADFNGGNVVMLDDDLNFMGDAVSKDKCLVNPFRLCFDEKYETLYIGEHAGDCRVLAYKVRYTNW